MSGRIEAEELSGGGWIDDRPGWFAIHLSRTRELAPQTSNLSIELPEEVARFLLRLLQEKLQNPEGQ
jgi:hypothetical protein